MFGRILGAVGRTLISIGVLMLLFVAYEIWGTNLQEASSPTQAQQGVRRAAGAKRPGGWIRDIDHPSTASDPLRRDDRAPDDAAEDGSGGRAPAERRRCHREDPDPEIGVSKTIVQGVTLDQLKRAPGHYPETPLPGQKGNAGIAGHRTTYGAPFHDIDKLKNGDEIIIVTLQGEFRYKVDSTVIVAPSDVSVLADKGDNRLTLTACSSQVLGPPAHRREWRARRQSRPAAGGAGPDREAPHGPAGRGDQATRVRLDGGIDGQQPSKMPALLWGALCGVVWLGAWGLSRLIAGVPSGASCRGPRTSSARRCSSSCSTSSSRTSPVCSPATSEFRHHSFAVLNGRRTRVGDAHGTRPGLPGGRHCATLRRTRPRRRVVRRRRVQAVRA